MKRTSRKGNSLKTIARGITCLFSILSLTLSTPYLAMEASENKDGVSKEDTAGMHEENSEKSLENKWNQDFERLAKESGMDICIAAVDLTHDTKASFHSDQKILSASMIKVLIAEAFLKQVSEGKHSLDDTYVLKKEDIVGGAGSLGYRGAGTKVSYHELLLKMISESDNVAANVLMDTCGIDEINKEAERLELKNTVLGRHMMDTEAAKKGLDNYTCADDLVTLFQMVYDKTFVNEEMSRLMLECLEAQTDNECISRGFPKGTVFAHKTGTLTTVRHDGGIVEGERPFILVTLCGGDGFYESKALESMKKIGEAAYADIMDVSNWQTA